MNISTSISKSTEEWIVLLNVLPGLFILRAWRKIAHAKREKQAISQKAVQNQKSTEVSQWKVKCYT